MKKQYLSLFLLMMIFFVLAGVVTNSNVLAREGSGSEVIEIRMDRGEGRSEVEPVIYQLPEDAEPELRRMGMPAQVEQKLPLQVQEKKQERSEARLAREEKLRSMNRSDRAKERMSDVAKSVQTLLSNPEREGGIGQDIREITKQQQDSQDNLEENLGDVNSRNKFLKFVVGTDRKALNEIKKETSQIDSRITRLNALLNSVEDEAEQEELNTLIEDLEGQRNDLLETVELEDSSFSLLGWMSRLF